MMRRRTPSCLLVLTRRIRSKSQETSRFLVKDSSEGVALLTTLFSITDVNYGV
jgi:hypothetical protein